MVRSSITCDQTHTNLSRMLYLSIYIPISLDFYSRGLMLVLYFPLMNKLTEPKCLIQDHLTAKSPNQNSYPVFILEPVSPLQEQTASRVQGDCTTEKGMLHREAGERCRVQVVDSDVHHACHARGSDLIVSVTESSSVGRPALSQSRCHAPKASCVLELSTR